VIPFEEHGINIRFCVKLGKNATDTGAMLSEACGGEAMKKPSISVTQTVPRRSHVEITNEDNAITFFVIKGIVRFEFIPQGQIVNWAYYMEIWKRLREVVRRKRPELWPKDLILNHVNAPAHKALFVKQFPTQKSITEVEHTPFIPLIWFRMTSGCFQK
jgi:hypothetical protein